MVELAPGVSGLRRGCRAAPVPVGVLVPVTAAVCRFVRTLPDLVRGRCRQVRVPVWAGSAEHRSPEAFGRWSSFVTALSSD